MGSSAACEADLAIEAAGQWGMFTAAQATRLGLTRKRLTQLTAAGRIHHADTRGVYRFAGAPEDITLDTLRALWLALDPESFAGERIRRLHTGGTDAIVSHLAAAHYVHGLGSLHPDYLDFTVVAPRRSNNPLVRFRVAEHTSFQIVAGLPVTTIAQTVADLYSDGIDAGHLGDILTDALLSAAADMAAITAALDPLTDNNGRDTILHALSVVGAPESLAEANELLFASRR